MALNPEVQENRGSRCFNTTRWSVILSSADECGSEEGVHAALTELCQTYWRPVFVFVCSRGYQPNDAQDLTQDFFVHVLKGSLLRQADPQRGRFRSLLLTALQHFLSDAHAKKNAKKRGGGVSFVSWDDWMAEAPSRLSVPSQVLESWPAERLFDMRWAATVVEQAFSRLRDECERRGRQRVFDVLRNTLSADRGDVRYEQLGHELGIDAAAVKRVVHQLRRRYRQLLREEVAHTVAKIEDLDDELRYLCAILGAEPRIELPDATRRTDRLSC